jgi:hypothetical protein
MHPHSIGRTISITPKIFIGLAVMACLKQFGLVLFMAKIIWFDAFVSIISHTMARRQQQQKPLLQ